MFINKGPDNFKLFWLWALQLILPATEDGIHVVHAVLGDTGVLSSWLQCLKSLSLSETLGGSVCSNPPHCFLPKKILGCVNSPGFSGLMQLSGRNRDGLHF